MKKHLIRILTVLCMVCLGAALFVGCKPEEEKPGPDDATTTYTVTYDANGGKGTAPATQKYEEGATFKVAQNPFTKDGETFKAWNDGSRDYAPGADYTMPKKNVTFKAQWTKTTEPPKEQVTVTIDLGGVAPLDSSTEEKAQETAWATPQPIQTNKGEEYILPAAPAWWAGHMFIGWKVGSDNTVKKAGEKITASANVTITAQWEETQSIKDVALEATEDTVYVVVHGSYKGYTDEAMLDALENGNQRVLKFSVCLGVPNWDYQELDIESTAENGNYTVKIDVTDLDPQYPYAVTENRNGYGNIRAVDVDDTEVVDGSKYYLHAVKGSDLLLNISSASKTYDIADITLTQAESKVYLTFTGTFVGYSETDLKTLLEDENTIYFWGNGGAKRQNPPRTATFTDGEWTLKIDVTDMPDDTEYAICQVNVNDLTHPKADAQDIEIRQGTRIYTLIAKAWNGYVRLTVSTEKGTCAVTGLDLELDETANKVYLIATGTFTEYTEAELKELFEGTNKMYVHFWDDVAQMETPTSVVVTTEGGNWTAKCDVTDLKVGELRNVLINGELKLDIQDKTVTLGNKTFTLQKANGYGNNGLKVEVETSPTDPTYEVTTFTIEKQSDEKVYLVYKGTCANYEQAALEAALKQALRFDVHKIGGTATGAEGNGWTFTMNGGNWEMKLNITVGDSELFTVGTYFIDSLNDYTDGGKYFNLWNQAITVEAGTYQYKTGGPLSDPNTWTNVSFTIESTAKPTYTFERPTLARLELANDKGNGTDENFKNDIERAFFVISGTYTGEVTEEIAKEYFKQANYPFQFGGLALDKTKDRIRRISIDTSAHTYTVKFDVTWLEAGEYICRFGPAGGTDDLILSTTACPDNTVKSVGSTYSLKNYNDNYDTVHWGCIYLTITRNYAVTGVELKAVDGKANLVVNGTFETDSFSGEQIEKFLKDEDVRSLCVDLYAADAWKKITPTITTGNGTFSVTLDVTALAPSAYIVASDCSGNGNIKNATVDTTITVGNKTYKLNGTEGSDCTLTIADAPVEKTFTPTKLKLEMSEDGTKAYVVLTATSAGYTQEELATLLYVDGDKSIAAASATLAEGVATVKFDFTNAQVAWWWPHYKFGADGQQVDIRVQVKQQSVCVNGKQIVLFYHSDNAMPSIEVFEASLAFLNAKFVQESDKLYLVLTAYNVANYTEAELKTLTYIGELETMKLTDPSVTIEGKNVTFKFDVSTLTNNGKWWWGHYTINGGDQVDLKGGFESGEVTFNGKKYSLFNNNGPQIIFDVKNA